MRIIFGGGSSERWVIQAGTVCFVTANLGCHTVEGPESHGSTSILNVPTEGGGPGKGRSLSRGEKVRRKVLSPLMCLTVKDMMPKCNR